MHARDRVIDELTVDNEKLRSELNRVKHDFDKTGTNLKEQEEILDQCQERIAALIVENDATKTELEWKVEDLSRARTRLEEEVANLRKKLQSLQVELDNSEAVQRDFVKLSQSLQVSRRHGEESSFTAVLSCANILSRYQIQLEKIRQADSEVRWQHEDDVSECNTCNKRLNSKKDKVSNFFSFLTPIINAK